MVSQVVKPKLWMVEQPMKEIACRAAELMLQRLSGEKPEVAERIILETQMFEGESVLRCRWSRGEMSS